MEQYDSGDLFNAGNLLKWLQSHGEDSIEEITNIGFGNFVFTRIGGEVSCYEKDHMEFKVVANVKYKTRSKKSSMSSLGLDPM